MKQAHSSLLCPCGTGQTTELCCQPYIDGTKTAPTAEALMRSRYTAYSQNNAQYLLRSWHHSTRPDNIDIDPAIKWTRLIIISSNDNQVEFVAIYKLHGKAHKLHENSRFVHENQEWFYLGAQ